MTDRQLTFTGNRCPRCQQNDPPAGHDTECATWHRQMDSVTRAAKRARELSPSYPVTTAQAIDLLAHLRSGSRPAGRLGIPDAEQVVQLVLDLGWRPFTGALAAVDVSLPDPGGTGDLLVDLPP